MLTPILETFQQHVIQFYLPELPNPEKMDFRTTSETQVVLVSKVTIFKDFFILIIKCSLFLLILLLIILSIFIKAYYYCTNKIFLIFIINFKGIMRSLISCMDEKKLREKSSSEKVILISNSSIYLKLIVAFSKFHFSSKLYNTCRKPF